jgi:drug/metabolite transporter (DMT)-like permease
MLLLIFSILTSAGILVVFKLSGKNAIPALQMVLINYLTAGAAALYIEKPEFGFAGRDLQSGYFIFGAVIGICFVLMFLFIEYAITKIGISIVSSSTKLSVVLPIIISILIDQNDGFSALKGTGLLIMIVALAFLMINSRGENKLKRRYIIPLFLFFGMGIIDSLVKISQQYFVPQGYESLFSFFVFFVSFLFATILVLAKKQVKGLLRVNVFVSGFFLGLFNFGSLFFILKTLNLNLHSQVFLDSSRILMFNNIGIVLISVAIGVVFFKEKISLYNYLGIMLSVIGFLLLI